MANRTKISWTERTWNPASGCDAASTGCQNCYAAAIAHRFAGTAAYPRGFEVTLHPQRLPDPLRWRQPTVLFVGSMTDVFHPRIPTPYLVEVFAVMAATGRHTFQLLTKRPARAAALLRDDRFAGDVTRRARALHPDAETDRWPLPNVWLGTSVENQHWAQRRIPTLLSAPAQRHYVSAEPLLGPVDLTPWLRPAHTVACCTNPALDWVIVGGESGPRARGMDLAWAARLVEQCTAAAVPVWVKQLGTVLARRLGTNSYAGDRIEELPPDLRHQQRPPVGPPSGVHPELQLPRPFRPGDRVQWNPTGDTWKPATVGQASPGCPVLIVLDDNEQAMHVRPEHLRPCDDTKAEGDPTP